MSMTDNMILEAIAAFCRERVSPQLQLRVPTEDTADYRLVHPNAFVGWVPPAWRLEDLFLQLPAGTKEAVPAIIVGMDRGEDTGQHAGLSIRITCIVYNPQSGPTDGSAAPNYSGYQDLLNLMFICREQLSASYLIGEGTATAERPFQWGLYHQQPADYWAGWLTFKTKAAILPFHNVQKLLQD